AGAAGVGRHRPVGRGRAVHVVLVGRAAGRVGRVAAADRAVAGAPGLRTEALGHRASPLAFFLLERVVALDLPDRHLDPGRRPKPPPPPPNRGPPLRGEGGWRPLALLRPVWLFWARAGGGARGLAVLRPGGPAPGVVARLVGGGRPGRPARLLGPRGTA